MSTAEQADGLSEEPSVGSLNISEGGRSAEEKAAKKAAKAAEKAAKDAEKAAKVPITPIENYDSAAALSLNAARPPHWQAAMRGVKQSAMTQPEEDDPLKERYGDLEMVQSKTTATKVFTRVEDLTAAEGQKVGPTRRHHRHAATAFSMLCAHA